MVRGQRREPSVEWNGDFFLFLLQGLEFVALGSEALVLGFWGAGVVCAG